MCSTLHNLFSNNFLYKLSKPDFCLKSGKRIFCCHWFTGLYTSLVTLEMSSAELQLIIVNTRYALPSTHMLLLKHSAKAYADIKNTCYLHMTKVMVAAMPYSVPTLGTSDITNNSVLGPVPIGFSSLCL